MLVTQDPACVETQSLHPNEKYLESNRSTHEIMIAKSAARQIKYYVPAVSVWVFTRAGWIADLRRSQGEPRGRPKARGLKVHGALHQPELIGGKDKDVILAFADPPDQRSAVWRDLGREKYVWILQPFESTALRYY